ncbi:hypothetical protein [Burkholderia cenocepacia]|uniref:hypothetical protein n=1 Tax=Burkholderia cenocepacia TaxID=95486 RepID=UPI001B9BBAEC|nr:hypothetical protein [Burkholderia cenocepacia]MBR8426215.1 hypothetical protein [Burkholderia cenocepacia]
MKTFTTVAPFRHDEVLQVLSDLGEDPTSSRVSQVLAAIDIPRDIGGDRAAALLSAVQHARETLAQRGSASAEALALDRRINNAILIYENNGTVMHTFMPEAIARQRLDEFAATGRGGTMFATEDKFDAEAHFRMSPDLRDRVSEAEAKLRRDLYWRRVMDKHGVPPDPQTRACVARALREIIDEHVVNAAVNRGHSTDEPTPGL